MIWVLLSVCLLGCATAGVSIVLLARPVGRRDRVVGVVGLVLGLALMIFAAWRGEGL